MSIVRKCFSPMISNVLTTPFIVTHFSASFVGKEKNKTNNKNPQMNPKNKIFTMTGSWLYVTAWVLMITSWESEQYKLESGFNCSWESLCSTPSVKCSQNQVPPYSPIPTHATVTWRLRKRNWLQTQNAKQFLIEKTLCVHDKKYCPVHITKWVTLSPFLACWKVYIPLQCVLHTLKHYLFSCVFWVARIFFKS